MTLNEIEIQIRNYKREFGEEVGELPVYLSGWPTDREVESIALVDDDDCEFGQFGRAEIVG